MNSVDHLKSNTFSTDVLVIGSGGSGLFSAIQLCKSPFIKDITVVTKSTIKSNSTNAAKGGINATLDAKDKWQWHAFDTIKGGGLLSDYDSVELMCKAAPSIIDELVSLGVAFSCDENGQIIQRVYGGQKTQYGTGDLAKRCCFYSDFTGMSMMNALSEKVMREPKIKLIEHNFLYHFDLQNKAVTFLDYKNNSVNVISAKIIIFASGGYCNVYESSTCSSNITCDSIATLAKEGFAVKDVEFVQFHPTSIYKSNILISEACRSEGGILRNANGERFMQKYDSKFMELAPRDVVSRAIFSEMSTTGSNHVYLDLTNIPSKTLQSRVENAVKAAQVFVNIDVSKQMIPVRPSSHYSMGGIEVDNNYMTDDYRIFVVGEASCASVHGANRLGCNSLLEIFYSAFAASKFILDNLNLYQDIKTTKASIITNKTVASKTTTYSQSKVSNIVKLIKNSMDSCAGIIKIDSKISECIKSIQHNLEYLNSINGITNTIDLIHLEESKNILFTSYLICLSSLKRMKNIGSFFKDNSKNETNPMHSKLIVNNFNQLNIEHVFTNVRKNTTNEELLSNLQKYEASCNIQ